MPSPPPLPKTTTAKHSPAPRPSRSAKSSKPPMATRAAPPKSSGSNAKRSIAKSNASAFRKRTTQKSRPLPPAPLLLRRYLRARFPSLAQPDRNGLLAALHFASLSARSGFQFAVLELAHHLFHFALRHPFRSHGASLRFLDHSIGDSFPRARSSPVTKP